MNNKMYIDNQWVNSSEEQFRKIINPANQEILCEVVEGSDKDTLNAINAARKAFDSGVWSDKLAKERSKVLRKVGDDLIRKTSKLAKLETLNTGKTLTESIWDIEASADVFFYYADLVDKLSGKLIQSPLENSESRIINEPIGVCGLITPWNYPLLQLSYKVAPSLAAGNTIIIKPSELTPLTTIRLVEILEEIKLPKGTVNLVLGSGKVVGETLSKSKKVDMISFTGSLKVGKRIIENSTSNIKKVSLELGGKNPNIVFSDADFNVAIDYALNAIFMHGGQVCSAGSRLLLEESIHDKFIMALKERIGNIRMGNGLDSSTEMGPLISEEHLERVDNFVQIGIQEGAHLLIGGERANDVHLQNGNYYLPTVFTNCTMNMRIVQEEIFGPVLTVEKFNTFQEAVDIANNSIYGLSASIFTKDIDKASYVADKLRVGTVWINDHNQFLVQAPWGGYKQSSLGRELGEDGLEPYTETKHIFRSIKPITTNWFK